MTATAWQNSAAEGERLVDTLDAAIKAGAGWHAEAVEVPAVVVTHANADAFVAAHPEAVR